MYSLILQLVIFTSLGVIIYLTARALPRIEEGAEISPTQPPTFSPFFSSSVLDKADAFVKVVLEKILRRMKIIVMKLDNFVSEHLGKIKK